MARMLDGIETDLDAVKRRQQQTWASGDFAVVAARIVLVAERLCDAANLHAGWRVLDVATGSGNGAIAAARLGCTAVGVGYVPALLERGRRRAAADGLDVELVDGDAGSLPEHRGPGFAGALVAALTRLLLADGRDFCFLFTGLANPTPNSISQQVGYRPVADVEHWMFEQPAAR